MKSGETPAGDHFLVQEFIDGRTLRSLLSEGQPLGMLVEIRAAGRGAPSPRRMLPASSIATREARGTS
jgi:hypothetical protein